MAPSRRKRSQSGSSGRSPALGARKPFGVVSAPTTRATSHSPARIWVRAASRAWRAGGAGGVRRGHPGAGPAERLGEGGAGDVARVAVAHGVGAGHELDVGPGDAGVAPARRAAAATPYSTKLRPHLPQGCMPTPRTATSSCSRSAPAQLGDGLPLPRSRCSVVVVGVQRLDDQLDLAADAAGRRRRTPAATWPRTTIPSSASSTAAMRERHVAGRCAGRRAAAAGSWRRCRTRRCPGATARPRRTPRPRTRGWGRRRPSSGRRPSRTSCTGSRAAPGPVRW